MDASLYAILISGAVVAVFLAIGALVLYGLSVRQRQRLERRVTGEAAPADELEGGEGGFIGNFARPGLALSKQIDKEGELTQLLLQAGARSAGSRSLFFGVWGLWAVICGIVAVGVILFSPKVHSQLALTAITAFVAVALAYLVPMRGLRFAAGARRDRIKREVPLFIHMLVLLFEAGLSTRQALVSMVREGAGVLPELGKEFESVVRQLDAGAELSPTLQKLGEEMDVEDLKGILGILRQVDRYGGEIREPLMDALGVIQERASLDTRERVNLISGRMTVVMVLFFLPALLVFTAGPAFVAIVRALANINHAK